MAISFFNSREVLVVSSEEDKTGKKHVAVLFRDKAGCVAYLKTDSTHNFKAGEFVTGYATDGVFILKHSRGEKDLPVSVRVKNTLDVYNFLNLNYGEYLTIKPENRDDYKAIRNLRTSYIEIYRTLKNIYNGEIKTSDEQVEVVMDTLIRTGQKDIDMKNTQRNIRKTENEGKEVCFGQTIPQVQENARNLGCDIVAFASSYQKYEKYFGLSKAKGQSTLDCFLK